MFLFWAGLGAALVVNFEFQARRGFDWLGGWWWTVPTSLVVQLSVYHLVRSDLGWIGGVALFGAGTALARIGLSFLVLHEPASPGNILAAAMLLAAVGIKLVWR
mgnify:CR=1 FL=1